MKFQVELEQEEDGRWIAEILELPGVMTYGATPEQARAKVKALALRVLADRLQHSETTGPHSSSPLMGEDSGGGDTLL